MSDNDMVWYAEMQYDGQSPLWRASTALASFIHLNHLHEKDK